MPRRRRKKEVIPGLHPEKVPREFLESPMITSLAKNMIAGFCDPGDFTLFMRSNPKLADPVAALRPTQWKLFLMRWFPHSRYQNLTDEALEGYFKKIYQAVFRKTPCCEKWFLMAILKGDSEAIEACLQAEPTFLTEVFQLYNFCDDEITQGTALTWAIYTKNPRSIDTLLRYAKNQNQLIPVLAQAEYKAICELARVGCTACMDVINEWVKNKFRTNGRLKDKTACVKYLDEMLLMLWAQDVEVFFQACRYGQADFLEKVFYMLDAVIGDGKSDKENSINRWLRFAFSERQSTILGVAVLSGNVDVCKAIANLITEFSLNEQVAKAFHQTLLETPDYRITYYPFHCVLQESDWEMLNYLWETTFTNSATRTLGQLAQTEALRSVLSRLDNAIPSMKPSYAKMLALACTLWPHTNTEQKDLLLNDPLINSYEINKSLIEETLSARCTKIPSRLSV